jgi:hypothetical protein
MQTVRTASITAAVLALILVAAVPAAQAQSRAKSTTLGAFGGYNIASDIYTSYSGPTSGAKLALKDGFEWGGRLTHFTGEYSAVEFAYTRNGADMELKNYYGGVVPNGFDAGRVNVDQYDLNFLMSKPTSNPKLWPYFTLGIGLSNTKPEVNAIDPNTSQPLSIDGNSLFAWNIGIGTMLDMNPKLGLRFDAKWRVTDTNITTSSGVYCDYWGYCWSYSSDWYSSGELTAGLQYKFGGR